MQRGNIVKALRGRDKGQFQVVLASEPPYVLLSDGKRRPLERPKRKKAFHTAPTNDFLDEESLGTNRQIRAALRKYSEGN